MTHMKKILIFLLLPPALLAQSPQSTSASSPHESVPRGAYLGVDIGTSLLEIQEGEQDSKLFAGITGGYRVNDNIALEARIASLGAQASESGVETVSVSQLAGRGLLYLPPMKYNPRNGARLELYGSAGVAQILQQSNLDSNTLPQPIHLSIGVGSELYMPNGYSARAEMQAIGDAAKTVGVSLIKRFDAPRATPIAAVAPAVNTIIAPTPQIPQSQVSQSNNVARVSMAPAIAAQTAARPSSIPQPRPSAQPVARPVSMTADQDGDRVIDQRDQCPATFPGKRVGPAGCSFSGVQRAIQFAPQSAMLTPSAMQYLRSITDEIRSNPRLRVEVRAHTGLASAERSLERAFAVKRALMQGGVAAPQIIPVGYGSKMPLVRSSSPDAARANERIELVLSGSL